MGDGTAACGNGIVEEAEECDWALDLPSDCPTTCGTIGMRSCTEECTWSPCRAVESCGNDEDEDCDGRIGEWVVGDSEYDLGVFWVESAVAAGDSYAVAGVARAGEIVESVVYRHVSREGVPLGDLVEIDEVDGRSVPYSESPRLAFSGSDLALMWSEDPPTGSAYEGSEGVYFTCLSLDGERTCQDLELSDASGPRSLSSIYDGLGYGLFWRNGISGAHLTRVSTAGTLVEDRELTPDGPGYGRTVLWTGEMYVLIRWLGCDAWRLTPSGEVVDCLSMPDDAPYYVDWSGREFGLAWYQPGPAIGSGKEVYGRTMSPDGDSFSEPLLLRDRGEDDAGVILVQGIQSGFAVLTDVVRTSVVGETDFFIDYEDEHMVQIHTFEIGGAAPAVTIEVMTKTARHRFLKYSDVNPDQPLSVFRPVALVWTGSEIGLFFVHGSASNPSSFLKRIACDD